MNWYALITAVLWGLTYTFSGEIVKQINVKTYLTISCLFSFLMFISFGMWDGSLIKDASSSRIPIFYIVISCVSSLLASYFSINAVKECGPTNAALIELTYPLWTIVFMYLMFGVNTITVNTIVGGVLILIGTLVVLAK